MASPATLTVPSNRRTFPSDPQSVRAARRFVSSVVGHSHPQHDILELLVSEVVTNGICHVEGDDPISVTVDTGPDQVTVAVRDTGHGIPHLRNPAPHCTGGRGLNIVETLATAWGSRPWNSGTEVWFTLTRPLAG